MIETIIQGGAVGIAIFLIWYMDRRDKRSQKAQEKKDDQLTNIVTNHINSNTKSNNELTSAIYDLKTTITRVNGRNNGGTIKR